MLTLDGDDVGRGGDTVGSANGGTSGVGSVAVTVLVRVTTKGSTPAGTATKGVVGGVDTLRVL